MIEDQDKVRAPCDRTRRSSARIPFIIITFLLLQACQLAYHTAGNVALGYSQDQLVPYVLSTTDLPMACATGTSLNHLLLSFSLSGVDVKKIAVLEYALAAFCVEQSALDAELDSLKAIASQNREQAQDARIRQQRLLALAAQRQYSAFLSAVDVYGDPAIGCPTSIQGAAAKDTDQLAWTLAMLSGLQALINDKGASNTAGIPNRVLTDVIKGSTCLDNKKWWQLPQAIRSGLWAIAPALNQADNPWRLLHQAAGQGMDSGVRLAAAVYLVTATSLNNEPLIREIIRDFSRSDQPMGTNNAYALLDALARAMALRESDKLWIRNTGHRTPVNQFGRFWDDQHTEAKGIELDDLL